MIIYISAQIKTWSVFFFHSEVQTTLITNASIGSFATNHILCSLPSTQSRCMVFSWCLLHANTLLHNHFVYIVQWYRECSYGAVRFKWEKQPEPFYYKIFIGCQPLYLAALLEHHNICTCIKKIAKKVHFKTMNLIRMSKQYYSRLEETFKSQFNCIYSTVHLQWI